MSSELGYHFPFHPHLVNGIQNSIVPFCGISIKDTIDEDINIIPKHRVTHNWHVDHFSQW